MPLRTLNSYLGGESEPKATTLARILAAANVRLDEFLPSTGIISWEVKADSSTFVASETAPEDATSARIKRVVEEYAGGAIPAPQGYVQIPKLSIRASAGGGRTATIDVDDGIGSAVAFREDWMRKIGLNPRYAQALTAVGDSMEPTIRDGDLLLIDRSVDRIVDNGIYVLVFGGLVLVKRVQIKRDGSVVLKSDNNGLFDDETVPQHELHELVIEGRVRWFGRTI